MAYNNDEKNYSDYFKSLENRISNERAHIKPPKEKTAQKSRRVYKVIRIKKPFLILTAVLLAGLIALISVSVHKNAAKKAIPQNAENQGVKYSAPKKEPETPKISYAETESTAAFPDTNDAAGAVIVNLDTHNIVASRAPHERLYPASTTKIMTLLVAAENIKNYEDTFTMTLDITDKLYIAEATVAGFTNGEKINMTDLLYGTILPSGADAAIGLAIKLGGSEEGFVKLMNDKAKALGLKDTHFTNVTGLFDKEHYTSAYDMAIILETAIENPLCKKILSTYQYTSSPTEQHPEGIQMSATLFNYMYGTEPETATIEGGKTGFVNESGYCIASFGSNNTTKNRYIAVTLKNSSRWPAFHGQIELYKQFAQ
ncbi:MAG TPA: hypothetical protein DCY23_01445 [Ruminococcaceae bacterium]|nr:hypothetical protein [Oscillospiraceae bacterium]